MDLESILSSELHSFASEVQPFTQDDIHEEPQQRNTGNVNQYLATDTPDSASVLSEEISPVISFWRKSFLVIRPGYVLDHLDYESFKVAIRTWILIWVGVILSTVPRTSHWLGSAAYLLQISGFICVTGGTLIVMNVKDSITIFIAVLVGWTHAIIAMKCANAIRNHVTMEQIAQALIDEGTCTVAGLEACVTDEIFSGRYLETKASVFFILALISGMVVFGLGEHYHMCARLDFIFGCISLVINCCYGVFIPTFSPLVVGLLIIKPLGISFVIKAVMPMIIFPTTSSYIVLSQSTKLLKELQGASDNNVRFLKSIRPSGDNFLNYKSYSANCLGIRKKLPTLDRFLETVGMEFAYSRLDAGDVKEFCFSFKNLLSIVGGYEYYYELLRERENWATRSFSNLERKNTTNSQSSNIKSKFFTTIFESYKDVGQYENKRRLNVLKKKLLRRNSEAANVTHDDTDHISWFISNQCSPLVEAANEGLASIINWLTAANEFRVYSVVIPGSYMKHKKLQAECHESLLATKQNINDAVAKFADFTKIEEILRKEVRNEDVLLCLISQSLLFLHLAQSHCSHILVIIDLFLSIDEAAPEPKLVSYFTKSQRIKQDTMKPHEVPDFLRSNVSRRNPDSKPPSSIWQVFGVKFVQLYGLVTNPHLWFWIRSGGLVVIAALPYFTRTIGGWYYSNRLVWLVIMTSLSTSEITGETIYVFLSKFFYTFFGCLLGMVAWYISAGHGSGNYYGYASVTAVVYLYLSYYRHFSVHMSLVPAILYCVTAALVLGTSWVDGQYNTLANIGYGFKPAWVRFVSVIIGLFLGSLACLFPKPRTSKGKFRKLLASVLSEVGDIHCLVSKFAAHRIDDPEYHYLPIGDTIIYRFRKVFHRLASVAQLVTALQFEIPISGMWPESKYKRLESLLADITQLYFLLFAIFDQVDDPETWIPIIFRRMGWTDSSLNADFFSIIHMASDSLRTKNELPKITEGNLSIRHMDLLGSQWGINNISLSERFYEEKEDIEEEIEEDIEDRGGDTEIRHSIIRNLDFKRLVSKDGQRSAVALVLAHIIYERLDQTMITIKGLVGEKYDFDETMFEDENPEAILLMNHKF